jgi:hypothetical protein
MKAIGRGINDGFTQCEAIAIVSTTDIDEIEAINNERTPTLQPCDTCLKIIDKSAVVVSVGEDRDIYEAHTCSQIISRRYTQTYVGRRARRRGETTPPIRLIEDPDFLQWAGSTAAYVEQAQIIELDPQ